MTDNKLPAEHASPPSDDVRLCDVSLREGEQAADAAFTIDQKVEIAQQLSELGVNEAQVGYPHPDADTVARLKASGCTMALQLLTVGFGDLWQEDIRRATDAGTDVVCILMRSADAQIEFLGFSRDDALRRTSEAVAFAVEQGAPEVAIAFSFASQADPAFLQRLAVVATESGASRIVLPDSMGIALPESIARMVSSVRGVTNAAVAIHAHNDFGLAVANTLAGIDSGAQWAEVSILGLGERAGNAPLDETVMALHVLKGITTSVDSRGLSAISARVAETLGMTVPPMKAIVGENAFAQKLDIHVMVSSKRPELFEPFDPALVGNRRALHIGKGSGPIALRAKLAELGEPVSDDELNALVPLVNQHAEATKRSLPDAAIRDLVAELRREPAH